MRRNATQFRDGSCQLHRQRRCWASANSIAERDRAARRARARARQVRAARSVHRLQIGDHLADRLPILCEELLLQQLVGDGAILPIERVPHVVERLEDRLGPVPGSGCEAQHSRAPRRRRRARLAGAGHRRSRPRPRCGPPRRPSAVRVRRVASGWWARSAGTQVWIRAPVGLVAVPIGRPPADSLGPDGYASRSVRGASRCVNLTQRNGRTGAPVVRQSAPRSGGFQRSRAVEKPHGKAKLRLMKPRGADLQDRQALVPGNISVPTRPCGPADSRAREARSGGGLRAFRARF